MELALDVRVATSCLVEGRGFGGALRQGAPIKRRSLVGLGERCAARGARADGAAAGPCYGAWGTPSPNVICVGSMVGRDAQPIID